MEDHDVRRIVFDCLNNEGFISALKVKLFNMEGLKSQADFDMQVNRIQELEHEKQGYDSTIEGLKDKITEIESANDELKTKLEQVQAQYHNDESKLEQYRTDMKNYLSQVESQEKEINELESANKKLQAQLTEAEEHFKTASAESIKHLQELKKLKEKLKQKEEVVTSSNENVNVPDLVAGKSKSKRSAKK